MSQLCLFRLLSLCLYSAFKSITTLLFCNYVGNYPMPTVRTPDTCKHVVIRNTLAILYSTIYSRIFISMNLLHLILSTVYPPLVVSPTLLFFPLSLLDIMYSSHVSLISDASQRPLSSSSSRHLYKLLFPASTIGHHATLLYVSKCGMTKDHFLPD